VIHRDCVLHPAREIAVEFDAAGRTTLIAGATRLAADRHGPAILDAFRPGLDLQRGLDRLAVRVDSPGEWMRLAATVRAAVDRGVLVPAAGPSGPRRRPTGFGAVGPHIAMLDDTVRTNAFCRAIARTVRPGDVVVDVGTGSGILAVAAARAGARRVYAIEVSDLAPVAAEVARANGFGAVVEVVRGWSTEVELPERGDVLVTETIGNDPLDEQILTIVADAAERLLHPGARIIPAALEVLAWPVQVPDEARRRGVVTPAHVARWREAYGIDLTPLEAAGDGRPVAQRRSPAELRAWRRLGPGTTVASVRLPSARRLADTPAELPLTSAGNLGGVLIGFRAALADGVDLTVGPANPGTHWAPISFVLPEPVAVRPGDVARAVLHDDAGLRLDVTVGPGPGRGRLAGLVVDRAIELRDLEPGRPDGEADVVVRRGRVDPPPGLMAAGPRALVGPHDVVLRAGTDRIHIRDGAEIVVDGPEEAPSAERELTVLGAGLAALCLQRGLLPLHASTVVGPAGAVAVCGERGAGKTTITARLDRDGRALLADDLTPVSVGVPGGPGGPEAVAGVRRFKLREDGLALLGLEPAAHPPLAMDGEMKWPVPAWCPLPAGDCYALVAVVVVVPDLALDDVVVEPLVGPAAVEAVRRCCFRPRWLVEPALARTVGRAALRIAAGVPVVRLRRPDGPESMERVVALVDDLVTGSRRP
jgi:precorrin-6B methylase 2